MSHRQRATSGYLDMSYPGELIVPEFSVNTAGSEPPQAPAPAMKTRSSATAEEPRDALCE